MTKREFLEKLRLSLNGKVSPEVVADNISYYEDYINTEIRKGKREEEVMEALGDPRLIARTIAETTPGPAAKKSGAGEEQAGSRRERSHPASASEFSRIPAWVWLILAIVAAVLVIGAVFSVLSVILPVLLPILAVVFLIKLFRDWLQ